MAAASTPAPRAATHAETEVSGWAIFAAIMLLVAGTFDLVFGLAAVLNDEVVTVGGRGVIVWDFTVWGWVHIVAGAAMVLVSWGLFAAKGWARWSAVGIATVATMLQLGVITAFPLWSIVMIALNLTVVYQLTAHWSEP
jgi:hypothetical protein